MKRLLLILMLTLLPCEALYSAPKQQPAKKDAQPAATPQKTAAQPDGDQVFTTNCARCHTPPMSISQRTTGTIIMHMRARARLSREDELLLLKYMAP
jgi:cytochrome c5